MTSPQSSSGSPPAGSFAEAARFQLVVALRMTYADRLRDLEAMWDFNDMIEEQNPRVRRVVELLRARRDTGRTPAKDEFGNKAAPARSARK
jgi:hypothetical protein